MERLLQNSHADQEGFHKKSFERENILLTRRSRLAPFRLRWQASKLLGILSSV